MREASLAEQVFTGSYDHGAGGAIGPDLDVAKRLALKMLGHYGMVGGLASWGDYEDTHLLSARTDRLLMAKFELVLGNELDRAKTILEANRDVVLALTGQLVEHKHLSGDQVRGRDATS